MSCQFPHCSTNPPSAKRSLDVWSLATLLVCTHYGLGFILGTAEQSVAVGAAGSLYAVSLSIGFLVLLFFVKFYWQSVEQIWTLLGDRYGNPVKVVIALMSWMSLIGIAAVQMIAAVAILNLVGLPREPTMVGLTILLCFLSLLPVERASHVFRGLLLLNIGALVFALWRLHSLSELELTVRQFFPDLYQVSWCHELGISIATILMVTVDMKCQQFIVRAKTVRIAYGGCILAAIALFALAFLPTAVVLAGQHQAILPEALPSKEILPYILSWIGGGVQHWQGILLILSLAVPALGIGSNILRIQTKTIFDFKIFPHLPQRQVWITIVNALFALAVALRGGEIVNLILDFYAAYLSSVWLPFIAYFLAQTNFYIFFRSSVQLALIANAIASVVTLGITLLNPLAILFDSSELTIMSIGMGTGCVTLILSQVVVAYRIMLLSQKEV